MMANMNFYAGNDNNPIDKNRLSISGGVAFNFNAVKHNANQKFATRDCLNGESSSQEQPRIFKPTIV
jgi:hypothetical protein